MAASVTYPEGNVLLRNLAREMPVISHGDGIYLFDQAGKRYIDASSGALVVSVGHGNKHVAEAMHRQLLRVGYVNGTQFTSEPTETLAARLAEIAAAEIPEAKLSRAAFLSSGSEVVEAAVKFVRQLWVEGAGKGSGPRSSRGCPAITAILCSRSRCRAEPHYKKLYGPFSLRDRDDGLALSLSRSGIADYQRDGAEHYGQLLEEVIAREGRRDDRGADRRAGDRFVGGRCRSTAWVFQAAPRRSVRNCTEFFLIADEVMCGAGRCGSFFACKRVGFTPDLLVLGKGIGGGAGRSRHCWYGRIISTK